MTPEQLVNALQCIAAIAFLIWFIYGPWQQFVLDTLRQNLFEIRDEIFLLAADGKLDFRSREYQYIRSKFNEAIRFAHELTWIQVLAFVFSGAAKHGEKTLVLRNVISGINDIETQQHVLALYRKASIFIMLSIVLRSPVLIILNMLLTPFAMVWLLADWDFVRERVVRPFRDLVDRELRSLAS